MLALVRPDGWNIWLFLHVAGAMALVASLIVALYAIRIARSRGDQPAAAFAFRVLWAAVLPSYLVTRVGAEVLLSKEDLDPEPGWIGIGYITSDLGLLLLIVGMVLTGLASRRARGGESVAGGRGLGVAGAFAAILIAAYIVAIWAMTTKPS